MNILLFQYKFKTILYNLIIYNKMFYPSIKPNDNVREYYEQHKTFHEGDCGIDLYCPDDMIVQSGDTRTIDFEYHVANSGTF